LLTAFAISQIEKMTGGPGIAKRAVMIFETD
jgi:hypothetical protein